MIRIPVSDRVREAATEWGDYRGRGGSTFMRTASVCGRMSHDDSGWRPKGGLESYKGYEVWEYEIGPHEINPGETDGEITFDDE